jgi:hypothetical protein
MNMARARYKSKGDKAFQIAQKKNEAEIKRHEKRLKQIDAEYRKKSGRFGK